jgi:hypothetical protein
MIFLLNYVLQIVAQDAEHFIRMMIDIHYFLVKKKYHEDCETYRIAYGNCN